jgi:multisubunit Na+/H+ antiporter MnhE subunit
MGRTVEILCWWVLLTGLWLVTLSSVSAPELLAAGFCAIPCAFAARTARRAMNGAWRPTPRWFSWLPRLPHAIVTDTAMALALVLRHPERASGELETVDLPDEPPEVVHARQAIGTVVIGCSPGTMVVDCPPRALIVHRLLKRRSSLLDAVRR